MADRIHARARVTVAAVALAGALLLWPMTSSAQLDLDLVVPESPAFTALGLSPEDITRPGTLRTLATSLLTSFDKQGNFQAGLALDTAPYVLAKGSSFDLAAYRSNPDGFNLDRFLARSQLSIATTQGTDKDDDSVRLALAARLNPWSAADPRMDDILLECLLQSPLEGGSAIPEGPGDETLGDYIERTDKAFEKAQQTAAECLQDADGRLSGGSGWDIGAAPTWIQRSGDGDISWNGATFWSSVSLRRHDFLSKQAAAKRDPSGDLQLILHTRFRLDEVMQSDDAPSGFIEQNSLLVGGRIRAGQTYLGSRPLTLSIESSYVWEDPEAGPSNSSYRGAVTADIKVIDQLWLHVTLGATAGRAGGDRIFIGATLKWGQGDVDLAQLMRVFGSERPAR